MTSTINQLLSKFFPTAAGTSKTLILGLDYAGKTSILYRLKLNEVVTTYGTIGFNVEDVEVKLQKGTFRSTLWDLGGGCGGIDWVRRMLHHYIEGAESIVWVVDSTDKERFTQSVEDLRRVIDFNVQTVESDKGKPNMFPILILANKSESPDNIGFDRIREVFGAATRGRLAAVYSVSVINNTGFKEAFGWLQTALEISRAQTNVIAAQRTLDAKVQASEAAAAKEAGPNLRSPTLLAQKLESWLTRIETDLPPSEFLHRFETYDLPLWDHYTHIRIAYLNLQKYGRQEGKDKIFQGIENYIANNKQARSRSFHLTMTYFWIQIVHFGMRNTPPAADGSEGDDIDAFSRFLLVNPHVVDGMLWEDFYSKDLLMGVEARSTMVLPDKKPLPSIAFRDAITNFGKGK